MRITKVEAIPFRVARDMDAATGMAGSPTQLRAAKGIYRWSSTVPALYSTQFETALIRLETDTGLVGWGEAQAPLAPEVACEIVRLLLTPVLEGAAFEGTTAEIEALWEAMYRTMRVRGQTGGFMLDAISGVDLALWDLAGKMQQLPVCALLGAAPRAVPAYVSGLPAANRAEHAARYLDQGFTRFKLFLDTATTEEFLASMDTLPAAAQVAVDALWRLEEGAAVDFGRELDRRRAMWFEAPMLPEDPAPHARLAAALSTPIALGESYRTRFEMAPFFAQRALRVFQPDLGRCGITEGLRLSAAAAEHGATTVPHVSIAMGPQIAAAIHFAVAARDCRLTEYNPQVFSVANRYLAEPLRMEENAYVVPDRPGLGIEVKL